MNSIHGLAVHSPWTHRSLVHRLISHSLGTHSPQCMDLRAFSLWTQKFSAELIIWRMADFRWTNVGASKWTFPSCFYAYSSGSMQWWTGILYPNHCSIFLVGIASILCWKEHFGNWTTKFWMWISSFSVTCHLSYISFLYLLINSNLNTLIRILNYKNVNRFR